MNTLRSVIVLVEPEPLTAEALQSSLRDAGFEVLALPDGEEALRLIEEDVSPIDAVLAEAAMSGVGGREIAAVLAEYRPDLPVVLMTSRVVSPDIRPGRERGPALPALDTRDPIELVKQLQATIEKVAPVRLQLRAGCLDGTPPPENRRLRAEASTLLRAVRLLVERRSPPACPKCVSSRVVPILYGSERLNRRDELASGKVVLGGPHRVDGNPGWYCRDCEHRW